MDSAVDLKPENKTPEATPVVQTSNLSKTYRTGFWMN
jgi:hypothetical protein